MLGLLGGQLPLESEDALTLRVEPNPYRQEFFLFYATGAVVRSLKNAIREVIR